MLLFKYKDKKVSVDELTSTLAHKAIIQRKGLLKKLYIDFYRELRFALPAGPDKKFIVELGSGGGFIKDMIPEAIASDVLDLPSLDIIFSVDRMPFAKNTVSAFVMINVLHHLSDARAFFREVDRCLKDRGRVVMMEPANTIWSRFINQNFHYERFNPSQGWGAGRGSPLFTANGAIPWIIFCRDRRKFEAEFPRLKVMVLKPHTPFLYLLSGGLSLPQLVPTFFYDAAKDFEKIFKPFDQLLGMFMTIIVEKRAKG